MVACFQVWELDANQSVVIATQHPIAIDARNKMGEIMRAVTTTSPGKGCQVTLLNNNPRETAAPKGEISLSLTDSTRIRYYLTTRVTVGGWFLVSSPSLDTSWALKAETQAIWRREKNEQQWEGRTASYPVSQHMRGKSSIHKRPLMQQIFTVLSRPPYGQTAKIRPESIEASNMSHEWWGLEINLDKPELGTANVSQCGGVNGSKPFAKTEQSVLI